MLLTINDIEELNYIAEEIIVGLRYNRYRYDADGNYLEFKDSEDAFMMLAKAEYSYIPVTAQEVTEALNEAGQYVLQSKNIQEGKEAVDDTYLSIENLRLSGDQ